MTVVHVLAGGEPMPARRLLDLGSADVVIAADSGAESAAAAGLAVDILVGDLDSITKRTLDELIDGGTSIEAHHPDKDATDLELALATALDRGADEIVVVGGGGRRLDHLLGNVAVVTSQALRHVTVRWELERETAYVVHRRRAIPITAGSTFSLIPIAGDAHGVTLTGSKWNLRDTKLDAGTSLGISNIAIDNQLDVEVSDGTLLVVVNSYH
ncbi:MAG: thiamine diphosphokinase [bacterium]|nr:thiamine diphosphokinase [bacterium]MDE0437881.1 thiamine diphosphokinase [bacterium]